MTSKGLRAKFYLTPDDKEKGLFRARLECAAGQRPSSKPAISLQLVSIFDYRSQYVRIKAGTLDILESNIIHQGEYRTVYVRQDIIQLLRPSRFPGDMNLPGGVDLFWVRGTPDFHFSEPIPSDQWNPQIGLFSLPPSETGRLLVVHHAGKHGLRRISLLFRISEGTPVCRLDDPQIVPSHLASHKLPSFGTFSQCILWRTTCNNSKLFATARISQSQVYLHPIFIITLYLKTIE